MVEQRSKRSKFASAHLPRTVVHVLFVCRRVNVVAQTLEFLETFVAEIAFVLPNAWIP